MAHASKSLLGTDLSVTTAGTVLKSKRGIAASLSEVIGAVAISVVILGLAGFGVGAGINYSQDSSAKASLDSVKSAQILHQSKTNSFGDLAELTTGDAPALTSKPDNVDIKVSADKRNYCAIVESGSMFHTLFWITSRDGKIVNEAPTDAEAGVACPTSVPTAP